jgi:hypothetical protein
LYCTQRAFAEGYKVVFNAIIRILLYALHYIVPCQRNPLIFEVSFLMLALKVQVSNKLTKIDRLAL